MPATAGAGSKLHHYNPANLEDWSYLSLIISEELGWKQSDSSPLDSSYGWHDPQGKPAQSYPRWYMDAHWPNLVREARNGNKPIGVEWNGHLVRVYFVKSPELRAVRGHHVGEVVMRAWARQRGLIK